MNKVTIVTICGECRLAPVEDTNYKKHEICLYHCKTCNTWTADVRADDFDGEFLSGYTNYTSVIEIIQKCMNDIDQHEYQLTLAARQGA